MRPKKIRPGGLEATGPEFLSQQRVLVPAVVEPDVGVNAVIMAIMPMFAADVVAVNPMMMILRPMAGHPDHLIITGPIAGAMGVVRPVADFDADPCRLGSGPESKARGADRGEQQCFHIHNV